MGFKEQIQADINNIFINFEEFATEHDINGVTMLAVIDEDTASERAVYSGVDVEYGNVYFNSTVMYVNAADLGYKPVTGGNIKIDGSMYQVNSVVDNFGVYEMLVRKHTG